MPTATLEAHHKLSSQLAAESVDQAHGIIRGATVAKSGVQATGKFYVSPDGTEYPVFTDEATLSSLMVAAKAAGKRVKVRTDHVDEIGARAGYADEFKLTNDGRVTSDIHLFKSFDNREIVLETSQETPEEIGLSIDFTPSFELRDGKAFMRVEELHAVDIVDEGAITHGGLFLSAGVDTTPKVETEKIPKPETMAADTSPNTEILTAINNLAKAMSEGFSKMSAPAAPAADPKVEEALKAANEAKEQLAAQKQEIVQMKREKALLGFRGSSEERAKLATAAPEEIEKVASEKKDYLKLVAERVETAKCKRSEAHQWVMKNHRDEYAAHLAGKGVIRIAA
jgi:hypothetical protein